MKKGLLTGMIALMLCICFCPALATDREPEYYWYMENAGGGSYLETANQAGGFFLSLDGGGSYTELPEVRAAARRMGLVFDAAVYPLDNGGVRVEARDIWGTKAVFSRDYSGEELAKAMETAVPTPVRVLCTNGTVTVGVREAKNMYNGDWSQGNYYGWAEHGNEQQLVYSLDGVTWSRCEPYDLWAVTDGWWDGAAFRVVSGADQLVSTDGVHWTMGKALPHRPGPDYLTRVDDYSFELVTTWEDGAQSFQVYLMGDDPTSGVLLPHMGEGIRAKGLLPGSLRAWKGPGETVILAVYDQYQKEGLMYSLAYPTASLDWCLENLTQTFRTIEAAAWNETVELGLAGQRTQQVGYQSQTQSRLLRREGGVPGQWEVVPDVPWGNRIHLLPYNGKTFLVVDETTLAVYASEDGRAWRLVEAMSPEYLMTVEPYAYVKLAAAWTGQEYIMARTQGVYRHGMMGMSGGGRQEGYSKVYFLNKDLTLTGSYDFGRLVEAVGFLDGAYYAEVSNSTGYLDRWGDGDDVYDPEAGSTLYRSTDKVTWEALPEEYLTLEEKLLAGNLTWGEGAGVWGTEEKPLCSVAQLDRWRFMLDEDGEVYLMKDNAEDRVCLPHLGEAIRAAGMTKEEPHPGTLDVYPAQLTAQWSGDGAVLVTVESCGGTRTASMLYTADSLDWVKENLGELGYREPRIAAYKPGVADVAQLPLANGESEIVYRDRTTGGKFMYLPQAPWGNDPKLLPFSGKDFMVYGDGGLYLSSDGVNWHKATGEWAQKRGEWNTFPYSLVWTGDKYLVGFEPYGGYGKGANYESGDMGKAFFLDGELNLLWEHDFTQHTTDIAYTRRNVQRVGYENGIYYVQLSDAVYGVSEAGVYYNEWDAPVYCSSADGVNWESCQELFRMKENLKPIQ